MKVQRVKFVGDSIPNGVVLVEFEPPLISRFGEDESQTICAIADLNTESLAKDAVQLIDNYTHRRPLEIVFEGLVPTPVAHEAVGLFNHYASKRQVKISYRQ